LLNSYSIFGIGVDRKHALKWLFSKEKATLQALQKVYVCSENALDWPRKSHAPRCALSAVIEAGLPPQSRRFAQIPPRITLQIPGCQVGNLFPIENHASCLAEWQGPGA
jgi:hypothetical protein